MYEEFYYIILMCPNEIFPIAKSAGREHFMLTPYEQADENSALF